MLSIFALKKLCAFHGDIVQPPYVASLCPDISSIDFLERADCRLPTMIKGWEGVSEGGWLAQCMWK